MRVPLLALLIFFAGNFAFSENDEPCDPAPSTKVQPKSAKLKPPLAILEELHIVTVVFPTADYFHWATQVRKEIWPGLWLMEVRPLEVDPSGTFATALFLLTTEPPPEQKEQPKEPERQEPPAKKGISGRAA